MVEGQQFEAQPTPEEQIADTYLRDVGLTWQDLSSKRVLDVGAQIGIFAQVAKSRGIEIISLDINRDEVQIKNKPENAVKFVQADAAMLHPDAHFLPFQDSVFDMVIAHGSLEAIGSIGKVIPEVKRILQQNGEFRVGPGFRIITELTAEEHDRYAELVDRMEQLEFEGEEFGGDALTEEEQEELERLATLVAEPLDRSGSEGEELEERKRMAQRINQDSLAELQSIDPSFTIHEGNAERGVTGDKCFVMKKK